MSEKRAVINIEKAINALPEKQYLTVFTPVEGPGGSTKRILSTFTREHIINIILELGGVDVSDDECLRWGFGICFPLMTSTGPRWYFIETRPDFCPLCQGAKEVRNEVDFEIISEVCWVCNGDGKVLTQPVPARPKKNTELLVLPGGRA